MAWERLKRLLRSQGDSGPRSPELNWVAAADNPWGVPVLDVRPVTLTMLSASSDPQCASNAVSFGRDDGTSFIGEEPPVARVVEGRMRFPIDRLLAEGVLFAPTAMEQKWALFYHGRRIICVRSWRRRVQAVAHAEEREDHVEITEVHGTFGAEDEEPDFTWRVLDYLLRSHALNTVYPAPLPAGMEADPKAAATWCMSMFGSRAHFATPQPLDRSDPDRPLRTHSLLHIAVARGDAPAIDASLAAGVPLDLLAGDGLPPLHWALARGDPAIMGLLLDRGSSVDVRSVQGATPLMTAVQGGSVDTASFLLDRGADIDARDHRGFTALHRAAEMGRLDLLRVLLERGASPSPIADGHTPRSLAEGCGHQEVMALLDATRHRDTMTSRRHDGPSRAGHGG